MLNSLLVMSPHTEGKAQGKPIREAWDRAAGMLVSARKYETLSVHRTRRLNALPLHPA